MPDFKNGEAQQDFFDSQTGDVKRSKQFPGNPKTPKPILIHTSFEQLILAAILLILLGCLVFFLGILRGKSLPPKKTPTTATVHKLQPAPRAARGPQKTAESVKRLPRSVENAAPAEPVIGPPATLPGPPRNPARPYTIQLVTYKNRDKAIRELKTLKNLGFGSFIITSGDYYQVCSGEYETRRAAEGDLRKFSKTYPDRFFRKQ